MPNEAQNHMLRAEGDGGGMADGDLNLRAERTRRNTQHRQKR